MDTDQLRVGDAERDEVTSALHEHFAQGRLTQDELEERLTATLSARTVGDLRKVTRDLPGAPAALAPAGRDSWEPAAAYWGRGPFIRGPFTHGPFTHAWPRRGWGPRPFGPIVVLFLVIAAFAGAGWVIFPLIACLWFAIAFTALRYARRRYIR
jgi:hypothetical protein